MTQIALPTIRTASTAVEFAPKRSRVGIVITAAGYAVCATLVVTPIVAAWGGDYATYVELLNTGRLAEVFLLFRASGDPLSLIANGQVLLFYGLFAVLAQAGLSPTASLALVSGTSAFVISYFVLRTMRNRAFAIFLFTPFLLDLMFFQVRNGFALAIFLLGLLAMNRGRKRAYVLFAIAVMVHASMILFVVAYAIARRADRSRATAKDLATTVVLSKLIGVGIVVLYIGSSMTLHSYYARAGLLDESSFTGLMFFVSLVALYVLGGQAFIRRYRFEFLISVILLWLYPVFSQAMRVFASSFPFHIAALSNGRHTTVALLVLLGLMVFNLYQWTPLVHYLGFQ